MGEWAASSIYQRTSTMRQEPSNATECLLERSGLTLCNDQSPKLSGRVEADETMKI